MSSDISYKKYSSDLNLGEGLCICTSFHFPDSGLYLLNGFDFSFDLFWMAWHWKPAINLKRKTKKKNSFKSASLIELACVASAWK